MYIIKLDGEIIGTGKVNVFFKDIVQIYMFSPKQGGNKFPPAAYFHHAVFTLSDQGAPLLEIKSENTLEPLE